MNPVFALMRRKETVDCTVEINNTFEALGAHLRFDNGVVVHPGDEVLVHGAPVQIPYGSSQNFRRKHGYDARNGRITALAALIRGGIKQSRILTDCFGISGIRAHQFLVHFGAYQHDEARYARHAYDH